MTDGPHGDRAVILVDRVQDAVFPHSRGVLVVKGWIEPLADPSRVLYQRSGEELPDGERHLKRQILGQRSTSGAPHDEGVLIG